MAQVTATLHLAWRHRWLGLAFINLCWVLTLFGVSYSEKAMDRIVKVATWLMGPKITVS